MAGVGYWRSGLIPVHFFPLTFPSPSWQVYFEEVLPDAENAQGVVAILENTCDQAFTYAIHGSTATYIGAGDLHDPAYDDYMVSTGYGAFLGRTTSMGDESHCVYNVRVYPSKELEETFKTRTPLVFTIVVVFTFFFTSLFFVLHDCVIEKRQNVVMKKAVQSTTVVNTLFPAAVRNRLFEEDSKSTSDTFIADPSSSSSLYTPIVADLYEDCTVLFADLAGMMTTVPVVTRSFWRQSMENSILSRREGGCSRSKQ